jgi:glycogen debranching enzyme
MALFGRDSLLTSYMALALDPDLAAGTLHSLAANQGRSVVAATEEQPGRIVHETRMGLDFPLVRGGASAYYGSVDSTPLFVVLLGEAARWGMPAEDVAALLPHADRALAWVEESGDRDGDGFVEYERMTGHGLVNQGWKDSFDGITFADGRIARAPLALCEVQGYVYAAYLARALLAEVAGDQVTEKRLLEKAARLKEAFNDRFWLDDRGWYAVALDADKRPVDSLASNMGHCLWTGIVDEEKAARVAGHLVSPELFSGWGVRTLATTMGAYNPMSYHNGSVWPHDSALVATGLMRYGFVDEARTVATAVLDAAEAFGGRLPELFCGFDRAEYAAPLPYPTSCSPQAWAAAAPLQLVRVLLRLDPELPRSRVWFAPVLPGELAPLVVDRLQLGPWRVRCSAGARAGRDAELVGLPAGVQLLERPRGPHQHG